MTGSTVSLQLNPAEAPPSLPLSEGLLSASQPFVGRWNRLISTSNWEKGRIICQWRDELVAGGSLSAEYSDEAWGNLVGGVTGQHVGRLRRVYQRFGQTQEQFKGLHWSHFQSALDWNDAEMWLEGAVQSGWSVARMRQQRWETLGRVEADRPREEDVKASELDEDFVASNETARSKEPPSEITGTYGEVQGPRLEGPDFGDDEPGLDRTSISGSEWEASAPAPVDLVRPFENLPELPDDLADAFECFKLAVLHHKTDGWRQIALSDVLRTLEALKALAEAPSSEAAPF
ncbi:MAG: hypothetical protein ACKVP0_26480 [Pirellulaceae bacterium]